jgi:hypothetical protein
VSFALPYSCSKTDVSPDDSIAGTYEIITNPILCALPSMSNVKIKDNGSTFILTCNFNFDSSETISNIIVEKTDNTTYKLYQNSKELGSYRFMKYSDFKKGTETIEGWVLMLRFDYENKHFEFMGRK